MRLETELKKSLKSLLQAMLVTLTLLGAAGALEAVVTVLSIQNGVVPPNTGLQNTLLG